jgi:MEDS: MEthanogen/methylotroph, DcmR Sensory domain
VNAADAGILSRPDPRSHIVYPYVDEAHLVDAVCLFANTGLLTGEAVVLILTDAHIRPILERFITEGFDIVALVTSGQLVYVNAERLLASLMSDGIIDEHRFKSTAVALITRTRAAVGGGGVRVFGNMVDLTWRSQLRATERLEEIWNEVIREYSVPPCFVHTR